MDRAFAATLLGALGVAWPCLVLGTLVIWRLLRPDGGPLGPMLPEGIFDALAVVVLIGPVLGLLRLAATLRG